MDCGSVQFWKVNEGTANSLKWLKCGRYWFVGIRKIENSADTEEFDL